MELVFHNSRRKTVWIFLGSLAFVAGGIFLVFVRGVPGGVAAGWASICFFGACAAASLWPLFDRRPRLIINDEGLFDRSLRIGVIPWDRIVHAELHSISGVGLIGLELVDEDEYLQRMSRIKRAFAQLNMRLGFPRIAINLVGINTDSRDLVRLIRARIAVGSSGDHDLADD